MDLREAIERIMRDVLAPTRYHADYAASVEAQHDDDTLDLLPDDESIRGTGLSHVPIRHGLPGVRVRVVVGSRVLLRFEAGDPRRPYAALWEPGAIEEISFDGGQAPVARRGDSVAVYWPGILTVGPGSTINGQPFAGTVIVSSQSAGIIQSGAPRVKA